MKKMIIFALIMAISVATPIQAMAESVTQSDVEMQPSEQNIEQIIDEITSEPHPINSDAIQNVKEYIIHIYSVRYPPISPPRIISISYAIRKFDIKIARFFKYSCQRSSALVSLFSKLFINCSSVWHVSSVNALAAQ